MYNSNSNRYPTATATVIGEVQIKTTQYGDKAILNFLLTSGETVTVWDSLNKDDESILLNLVKNQTVTLYQNDHGNWKLDKKSIGKKDAVTHLSITPSPVSVVPQVKSHDFSLAITNEDHPIRKQARLLRDCVDAVLIEFHGIGLSDEIIQKYATSLYIQINKVN